MVVGICGNSLLMTSLSQKIANGRFVCQEQDGEGAVGSLKSFRIERVYGGGSGLIFSEHVLYGFLLMNLVSGRLICQIQPYFVGDDGT